MREDDALPISTSTSSSFLSASNAGISKRDHSSRSSAHPFGRSHYKFWALAVILLLALWSMIIGAATLRWSAGDLNRPTDDYSSPSVEDLDVLILEERERLVKHLWDVYTNSRRIKFSGFWQDAFVAAYEDLTSEIPEVRDSAFSEIAKMSVQYLPNLH
ncbi:hypothetical protein M569_06941, partial [Genlisea aurea]